MKKFLSTFILLLLGLTMRAQNREMLNYTELAKLPPSELMNKAKEYMEHNHVDTAIGYYVILAGKYHADMSKIEKYWCAIAYNQIGQVYYQRENHFNAFDLFLKGLQICEQNGFEDLEPDFYKNIGNVYCVFQDLERGEKYYVKALKLAREQKKSEVESKTLNNLISISCYTQQLEKAKEYYRESLQFIGKDSVSTYYQYRNRALIYLCEEKYDLAIACYKQGAAYAIQHKLEDKYASNAYMELAKLYNIKNDIDSTLYYYHLNTDDLTGKHVNVLTTNVQILSQLFGRIKDPLKAEKYRRRCLELSDSVFSLYLTGLAKNSQFVYEMDQNRRQIETLTLEKEKKEEKIREQRKALGYTLACLLVFVTLLIMVYIQKKRLKEAHKELFIRNREIIESGMQYKKERMEYEKKLTGEFSAGQSPVVWQKSDDETESPEESTNDLAEAKNCYSSSRLTERQKKSLLQAINKVMEDTDEFCNSNFGIDRLVELIGSNSSYISQAINESYNVNFRTYINEYRIREAQIRLMNTEKYGHYTIKAIAESVGYKSQNNFIETFKKITGMTPSVYQKMANKKL